MQLMKHTYLVHRAFENFLLAQTVHYQTFEVTEPSNEVYSELLD